MAELRPATFIKVGRPRSIFVEYRGATIELLAYGDPCKMHNIYIGSIRHLPKGTPIELHVDNERVTSIFIRRLANKATIAMAIPIDPPYVLRYFDVRVLVGDVK